MPTNTTGVPLGPGWPQDHPWIGEPWKFWFYPALEPENWKRHNGSLLNLVRCKIRSGKIARQFKPYTWDLLIKPIKIFTLEKTAEKLWKRYFLSILHYAKGTRSLGLQPSSSCMRGMFGSGLTPGTIRQDDKWKNHEKLSSDKFFWFRQNGKKHIFHGEGALRRHCVLGSRSEQKWRPKAAFFARG